MKSLILLSIVLFTSGPAFATENITINANKFCADAVNIPYASDNFSDFEWEQFQQCIRILSEYEVY